MSERVLLICLDAMEPDLIERWAEAGMLPNLARLNREAAAYRLTNRLELMPDALWPEINTGRSVAKTGDFNSLGKIYSGESRYRPMTLAEIAGRPHYWNLADASGRRVVVIDAIEGAVCDQFKGYQVQYYGLHMTHFPSHSHPPEALDDLRERFGAYPVGRCDNWLHGHGNLPGLREALLLGHRRKRALSLARLQRNDWDLFSISFSEAHCAGHQFWHLSDSDHPQYSEKAPEELRRTLLDIYREIDETVGELLAATPEDVTCLVMASHGMRHAVGAQDTLPEFLEKLGLGTGKQLRLRLGLALPAGLKRHIRKFVGSEFLERHQLGLNSRWFSFDGARTKAIAIQNFRIGAVRLNLRGREPDGTVEPGEEAHSVLATIEREAKALRDVRSGQPAVEATVRADDAFGPTRHPDLPDLFVRYRPDLGPIDAVRSERAGVLRRPQPSPRTGEHTDHAVLWIRGPRDTASDGDLLSADHLDLTPTILDRLGVDLPHWIDGEPIPPDA